MRYVNMDEISTTHRLANKILGPDRPVIQVASAPSGFEGEGFPVKRAFAGLDLSLIDPFLMMDEMGEVDYAPGEPKGTSWHPHRGFQTVTLMFEGVFEHGDNQGGGGTIKPGDTQWMTAGDGILHIEAPPEWLVQKGGLFHGLQLWVNLPRSLKRVQPTYQDIRSEAVTEVYSHDGASKVRIVAGEIDQVRGPGSTLTPITFGHVTVSPGSEILVPWNPHFNALSYVMKGEVDLSSKNVRVRSGHAAALGAGSSIVVRNPGLEEASLVLLGGRPIGEPIAWAGPFVMNTRAEVMEAYEDFRSGRFAQPA